MATRSARAVTTERQNPDVAWAVEDIRARLPERQKALEYFQGRHPLNFATQKFRNTYGSLFQELRDNMCDDVVNEPTDRLQILNWTTANAEEPSAEPEAATLPEADELATKAQEWWDGQRGQARSGSVHQNGFRSGDGFVIIWDANGDNEPRMYVQDPRQMAVRYSTTYPDQIEVAAKCWMVGKGYRLNLYYPPNPRDPDDTRARIEHWYSKGFDARSGEKAIPSAKAFQPYTIGAEGDADHVPPVEYHDKGLPVFHFPNGELGDYGTSVLNDVYGLQDALNKLLCDFMVSSEDAALIKRWATGIEIPRDPVTGKEVSPFKDGDNLWWTKSERSQFGQFTPAEVEGFLKSMRALRLEIARKGALPAHSVDSEGTGNAPSGLSLLIAEGKLIKRCKDRTRDWGMTWREMMAYVLSWMLSREVLPSDLDLAWAPIETRDEQALLETLALKSGLGVPKVQLLREMGYTDRQIVGFGLLSEDEQARAMDEAAAMSGGRISNPGGTSGTPVPPRGPAGADQPSTAGAA